MSGGSSHRSGFQGGPENKLNISHNTISNWNHHVENIAMNEGTVGYSVVYIR